MSTSVNIEASWREALAHTFQEVYFIELTKKIRDEKKAGKIIYPSSDDIFKAFELTPIDEVRVVILGQDPYHGPGQAMGLSFSVHQGIRIPVSLRNVYKELAADIEDFQAPAHGDLTTWARQGVFLLNAILTVEHKRAGSHRNYGWMAFTDEVIRVISARCEHVVFMLWGNFAKEKAALIDASNHLILEAVHPSPLARGGFFGCKHFSMANAYLTSHGRAAIDWQIPD